MNEPLTLSPGQIRVIGEREEIQADFRFGTNNTQLAAALLCLGFKLHTQPFSTVYDTRNPGGKRGFQTTIWFFPYVNENGAGEPFERPLTCNVIEAKWVSPTVDPDFPELAWMRLGMEERKRVLRDIVFGDRCREPMGPIGYKHDNVKLAASLQALGFPVNLYRDYSFFHDPLAKLAAKEIQANLGATRERWTIKGMEQQEILINAIKGPNNLRQQVIGGIRNQTAWLPEDMPGELKRIHLHEIN